MQFGTSLHLAIVALAAATSAALCTGDYPDVSCCQVTGSDTLGCLDAADMKDSTPAEFRAYCAETGRTAACCAYSDRGESYCEDV